MYETILFPTDGSKQSEEAKERALALAEQFDAAVHVFHVVDTRHTSEPALSSMELLTDEAEAEAMAMLKEIVADGKQRGLEMTSRCCHGIPHDEIVEYAEDIDADLIVMGYRGHSHAEKIGSVVDRVLQSTERQVLAV